MIITFIIYIFKNYLMALLKLNILLDEKMNIKSMYRLFIAKRINKSNKYFVENSNLMF